MYMYAYIYIYTHNITCITRSARSPDMLPLADTRGLSAAWCETFRNDTAGGNYSA